MSPFFHLHFLQNWLFFSIVSMPSDKAERDFELHSLVWPKAIDLWQLTPILAARNLVKKSVTWVLCSLTCGPLSTHLRGADFNSLWARKKKVESHTYKKHTHSIWSRKRGSQNTFVAEIKKSSNLSFYFCSQYVYCL